MHTVLVLSDHHIALWAVPISTFHIQCTTPFQFDLSGSFNTDSFEHTSY